MSGLDLGHGGPAGDGQFDEASREYRLHARGPVRHGDQVFLCYGVHTNLQLLGGPRDICALLCLCICNIVFCILENSTKYT